MKTYSIGILRKAFFELVDVSKYHKISVYIPNRKAIKLKARIGSIWAGPGGLKISFRYVWRRRSPFMSILVNVRDIHWLSNPLDLDKFEDLCQKYQKKLEATNLRLKEVSGTTLSVNRVLRRN